MFTVGNLQNIFMEHDLYLISVGLQIYKMINLGSNVMVYKLKKLGTLCFTF